MSRVGLKQSEAQSVLQDLKMKAHMGHISGRSVQKKCNSLDCSSTCRHDKLGTVTNPLPTALDHHDVVTNTNLPQIAADLKVVTETAPDHHEVTNTNLPRIVTDHDLVAKTEPLPTAADGDVVTNNPPSAQTSRKRKRKYNTRSTGNAPPQFSKTICKGNSINWPIISNPQMQFDPKHTIWHSSAICTSHQCVILPIPVNEIGGWTEECDLGC